MPTASLPHDQLEVLLEIRDRDDWERPTAAWDETTWDGPVPEEAWSDTPGWVNAVCDVRGFTIERGRQSVWDSALSARLELELDNRSGRYSVYGSESWARIRPGFQCEVWGTWNGVRYPLFIGFVGEYTEGQEPNDYKVQIKAQDAFRLLSDPIDVDYSPGAPFQWVNQRIHALLDRAEYKGPRAIDGGHSSMLNYATNRNLLDEIQLTANSDGGVFFIDNDGTAVYLDRNRIYGRHRESNETIPTFSDDCFSMPYAAIEPIMADNEFGNVIVVSNVSQGTDSPKSAQAIDQASIDEHGRHLWSPSQLVLCNAEFVQALADFHLSRRSIAFYRINQFECYPVHDDRLWPALLSMRIGDSMIVERTPPASNELIAAMICDGWRIEATPDLWKFVVRCSPGDKVDLVRYWDFSTWDVDTWL